MRYRITVLETVKEELLEAARFYEERRKGLGLAIVDEWEKTLGLIRSTPEGYQKKRRNFREALLDRFPYLIIYELDDLDITIYRFINTSRHPKKRYPGKK